MIITNESRLPAALVEVVSRRRRPRLGTFSVSELVGPPQIRALTLRHWAELTEDAASRLRLFTDGLLHHAIASYGQIDGRPVERLRRCECDGGLIAGSFDVPRVGDELQEYRSVSTWRVTNGAPRDWVERMNLYAEVLRRNGVNVTALTVVAMFRDFSASRGREANYPQAEVQTFGTPLWEPADTAEFLRARLALHTAAESGTYTECSSEERWQKPDKFALMKVGRQKAVRVYDDEETARANITSDQHYVEPRPGLSTRCEFHCRVAAFCPQRAAMSSRKAGEE